MTTTFAYGIAGIPYRVLERTESTITLATTKGAMKRPLSDVLGTIELVKGVRVCLVKAPGREYVFLQEFKAPTEFKDGVQEYEDWVYLQAPGGELAAWKLNQICPLIDDQQIMG